MKANEAPEKIFLHPDIGGREFIRPWLNRRVNQESVEYIRTDAFIEKACEYLSFHLDTSKIDVYYKFDFIEEFRKAMKL